MNSAADLQAWWQPWATRPLAGPPATCGATCCPSTPPLACPLVQQAPKPGGCLLMKRDLRLQASKRQELSLLACRLSSKFHIC